MMKLVRLLELRMRYQEERRELRSYLVPELNRSLEVGNGWGHHSWILLTWMTWHWQFWEIFNLL